MSDHRMIYRAGVQGLEYLGFKTSSPGWWCTCREWAFAARPMPRRASGNNLLEAEASFLNHARGVIRDELAELENDMSQPPVGTGCPICGAEDGKAHQSWCPRK